MNESETNSSTVELAEQVAGLRRQVFTLLLALIVVSGTVTAFLFYQSRIFGKDIESIRPQATQIIQVFNQDRPGMEKFVQQLVDYGKTHPDFQPILKKYGVLAPATNAVPKK